jgi:hypothetical protein
MDQGALNSQRTSFLRSAQDLIPKLAGMIDGRCAEALAHTALRVVREMKGVMAPEGAVVVPEVVVRVVR